MSIKDQIKASTSQTEIQSLLTQARGYKHISAGTLRKVEREAKKRIATLKSEK